MSKFKKWLANIPVANFGPYSLYSNNEIQKAGDRNRYSLAGATVEFDDGAELKKRVTATRFLAVGFFAFAFKKKSGGEKYLLIAGSDFTWLEEVPKKRAAAAVKFAQQVRAAAHAADRLYSAEGA